MLLFEFSFKKKEVKVSNQAQGTLSSTNVIVCDGTSQLPVNVGLSSTSAYLRCYKHARETTFIKRFMEFLFTPILTHIYVLLL